VLKTNAVVLQGATNFKTCQNPQHTVKTTTGGNGVEVGTGHQCWAIRIQPLKPTDQVARRIDPNLKASLVHPSGQQGTSRNVLSRETPSTDAAIGLQPNGSHFSQGVHQTLTVGSNAHLCFRPSSDLASGQEGRQCSGLQIKRSHHHRRSDPNGLSSMRRFNPHQRIQTGISTRHPRRSACSRAWAGTSAATNIRCSIWTPRRWLMTASI